MSIHDLMAKTIHYIYVHDFHNKCPELLPALLGQINFNANLVQTF